LIRSTLHDVSKPYGAAQTVIASQYRSLIRRLNCNYGACLNHLMN
jgi:hypothetical protein